MRICVALVGVIAATSPSAAREIVTFQFSGALSSVHDEFNVHNLPFTEGMAVRGWYSFDADKPPDVDVPFQKTYRQTVDDTVFQLWVNGWWSLTEKDFSITTGQSGVYVVESVGQSEIVGPERTFDSILWSLGLEDNQDYWINSQKRLSDVPPLLSNQPSLLIAADLVAPWSMTVDFDSLDRVSGPPVFQAGDANRDLSFDQLDIIQVLVAGKYLTGQAATWVEGDWSGDALFDQLDIVAALATGNYLTGPYASASSLPEPSSRCLILMGALAVSWFIKWSRGTPVNV